MFIRVGRATGRHLNIGSAAVALGSKLLVGELELLLLGWLGVAALDVLALVGGRTADSLPWWVAGQLAPLPGSSALCFPSGYVGVSLAGIPTKTPKTLNGKIGGNPLWIPAQGGGASASYCLLSSASGSASVSGSTSSLCFSWLPLLLLLSLDCSVSPVQALLLSAPEGPAAGSPGLLLTGLYQDHLLLLPVIMSAAAHAQHSWLLPILPLLGAPLTDISSYAKTFIGSKA